MTQPEIFFRTLLAQGPADTVARFAAAFGIEDEFILHMDADRLGYLEKRAKAVIHDCAFGDFNHYIELWLWEFGESEFEAALTELSAIDLAIAQPDDASESPFQYVLFLDGKRQNIGIGDDDDSDRNFVINDPKLRARLRQIASDGAA